MRIKAARRVRPDDPAGGKAGNLARLRDAGVEVPPWFVLLPPDRGQAPAPREVPPALRRRLARAVRAIAPDGARVAVRSSALGEDSAGHSFAGQLETVLDVAPEDVPDAVAKVWASAASPRVAAYRRSRGLEGPPPVPAVLVQRMVHPEAAGVAFGADPVTGDRGVAVVAAVAGLGETLVSGAADAETWRVAAGVATRTKALAKPVLDQARAAEVARLARKCGERFGAPQDIEWAFAEGTLWLLQSRPITTLPPEPEVALWDNSNIAESYAGVTTPLTFTFARSAYAEVYREMCRLLRVPRQRIEAEHASFEGLIGLVDGRIYYNLVAWYRVLALMPGFRFNRAFMEQMMGVREELPPEILRQVAPPPPTSVWGHVRQARTAAALGGKQLSIGRRVAAFHRRLDRTLAKAAPPDASLAELAAEYRRLEKRLLRHWDAPLLNDFLAMVFYGVLRRLCQAWCGDADGTLQNGLLCSEGDMVSAEPAARIRAMGQLARGNPGFLRKPTVATLRTDPALAAAFDAYLDRFGDRCMEELKLESPTLRDDPSSLVRAIAAAAVAPSAAPAESHARRLREAAEARARAALRQRRRRTVFLWVLRNARARVRDRENLRFERTRVFGRVRSLAVAMGERLHGRGDLAHPRDVFFLELDELLALAEGGPVPDGLRSSVAQRKRRAAAHRRGPPPPDRFLGAADGARADRKAAARKPAAPAAGGRAAGLGCCPGVARGTVRVILDPKGAEVRSGEILVARRTDPGWILLFPAAAGVLVEHGSLLSHAAIVSREMGIPSVVAVEGLTDWLRTGDTVELDGSSGEVRLLKRAQGARKAPRVEAKAA